MDHEIHENIVSRNLELYGMYWGCLFMAHGCLLATKIINLNDSQSLQYSCSIIKIRVETSTLIIRVYV